MSSDSHQKNIEHYFDMLLCSDEGDNFVPQHELADDEARFEHYDSLRNHLIGQSQKLDQLSELLKKHSAEYSNLISELSELYAMLSQMTNDNYDLYIRNLAIEYISYHRREKKPFSPRAISEFIQALLVLVLPGGSDSKDHIKQMLKLVRDDKVTKLYDDDDQEEVLQSLEQAQIGLEHIDQMLFATREGLVARDKTMLLNLQHLQLQSTKQVKKLSQALTDKLKPFSREEVLSAQRSARRFIKKSGPSKTK